jgi:hypothetical protein
MKRSSSMVDLLCQLDLELHTDAYIGYAKFCVHSYFYSSLYICILLLISDLSNSVSAPISGAYFIFNIPC